VCVCVIFIVYFYRLPFTHFDVSSITVYSFNAVYIHTIFKFYNLYDIIFHNYNHTS